MLFEHGEIRRRRRRARGDKKADRNSIIELDTVGPKGERNDLWTVRTLFFNLPGDFAAKSFRSKLPNLFAKRFCLLTEEGQRRIASQRAVPKSTLQLSFRQR